MVCLNAEMVSIAEHDQNGKTRQDLGSLRKLMLYKDIRGLGLLFLEIKKSREIVVKTTTRHQKRLA